ncbi:hypothetical protein SGRA_3553 [Saprospira grandis str. Lewin]|uniref:Uncharacterized protein n=1 Tax=Saprospira grandis (strain Lewin) TaxID=984262 RepID=H6L0B3_SAPGL|nr:hypothetical protein SGRA_3553 [Saprospira grandis str. Lewin]
MLDHLALSGKSPTSPRDSLGNPAEGWVGGDLLTDEERSDECRFKGGPGEGTRPPKLKKKDDWPSAAQPWPQARPRSKATQGRADLRAAQHSGGQLGFA